MGELTLPLQIHHPIQATVYSSYARLEAEDKSPETDKLMTITIGFTQKVIELVKKILTPQAFIDELKANGYDIDYLIEAHDLMLKLRGENQVIIVDPQNVGEKLRQKRQLAKVAASLVQKEVGSRLLNKAKATKVKGMANSMGKRDARRFRDSTAQMRLGNLRELEKETKGANALEALEYKRAKPGLINA